MGVTDLKKELHEAIDDADDRLLTLIYGMIVADRQRDEIPEWHKDIIQERLEAYEKNPSNVITWEELKAKIEKMR